MTCPICDRYMCDHSPAERGQTFEEVLGDMELDANRLRQQNMAREIPETDYCLFVDRRTKEGTDFTDLPLDGVEELIRVAEAALRIPYVTEIRIMQRTKEIEGKPWWGQAVHNKTNKNPNEYLKDEKTFRDDLKEKLKDDGLFERLYKNKERYKRLISS